jgi:uncharacterized membrane protein YdjX (TVP38/TMEM64 family)
VRSLNSLEAQRLVPPQGEPGAPRPRHGKGWWKLFFLALLVLMGIILAWDAGLYDALRLENLARLQRWVSELGPWAPILFTAAYVILELLFVPALPLNVLAGIAFGPVWGTLTVWIGATLSAALAFLITRSGGREMVERWVARNRRLAKIDEAVARHGWRILAFTRLVPIFPFNMQNYAYGLTGIRFSTYLFVSAVFMFPGTAALTLAGDALAEGSAGYSWLVIYLGIAGLLLVLLYIIPKRLGRRSGVADEFTGWK